MAVTPPRQCDSVSGFTGDKGGGEVREGRKVKDAPEEPLCSFRIYIARAGCAAPGPRRTSQEACALSTRAIFICAQGAAPLSLTLGIGCEGGIRSHVLRMAPRPAKRGLQAAARADRGAVLRGVRGGPPSPQVALLLV